MGFSPIFLKIEKRQRKWPRLAPSTFSTVKGGPSTNHPIPCGSAGVVKIAFLSSCLHPPEASSACHSLARLSLPTSSCRPEGRRSAVVEATGRIERGVEAALCSGSRLSIAPRLPELDSDDALALPPAVADASRLPATEAPD